MYFFKKLVFTFFVLSFIPISAQEDRFILEIDFEDDQTLAYSGLDYSDLSSADYFEFNASNLNNSDTVYGTSTLNMLILDQVSQAALARELGKNFSRRHPMEKTGRILTYIGVPLAIIGGIMVAGSDELYYNCVNGECTGDAQGGFGVVMLGAGSGLSITGAVLWILGSKK